MKLSKVERWILRNQYLILEKLYPDNAKHYTEAREILENGYAMAYGWITQEITEEVSEAISREVLDILGMFRALDYGYGELSDKSGIDTTWVKFPGFDGNEELDHYGFARFLIDTQGRFQSLHRGDNFNSHGPFLDKYRKMVAEWQVSKDKNKLTKADIQRIVEA